MAAQTFRIVEVAELEKFAEFPTRTEVDEAVEELSAGNYAVIEEIYRAERKEELTTSVTQKRQRPRTAIGSDAS